MQPLTIVLIGFVALAQASGIIPVKITHPKNNDIWCIGEKKLVQWKTDGIPFKSFGNVTFGNTEGGEPLRHLATEIDLSKGKASVTVPKVNHPGKNFWVAVLGRTPDLIGVGGTDDMVIIEVEKRGH